MFSRYILLTQGSSNVGYDVGMALGMLIVLGYWSLQMG